MYIYIIYIFYISHIYIYYSYFYITHTYIYIYIILYTIFLKVNQSDHMCCPGFSEPNSTGASVHRIIGGSFL